MQMIQISQKTFDMLFKKLCNELRIEQYQAKSCKCEIIAGDRPVENMHRHMHYHIHTFKKELEEA